MSELLSLSTGLGPFGLLLEITFSWFLSVHLYTSCGIFDSQPAYVSSGRSAGHIADEQGFFPGIFDSSDPKSFASARFVFNRVVSYILLVLKCMMGVNSYLALFPLEKNLI